MVPGGRVAGSEESREVVMQNQAVAVVVGGRTWNGVVEDLACSGGGVEGMRLEEAVVLVHSEQPRCSGCKAASQLERVASLGKVVVRIAGGTHGAVVVRRPKPSASWSWQVRAARSCSTRGTCP